MSKKDEFCLRHMLDATQETETFMKGRTLAELRSDRMLVLAVTKGIEILGEAANQVSPATRALAPRFPWDRIISVGRRLAHSSFKIDVELVWSTVQQDLPLVIEFVEPLIPSDSEDGTQE